MNAEIMKDTRIYWILPTRIKISVKSFFEQFVNTILVMRGVRTPLIAEEIDVTIVLNVAPTLYTATAAVPIIAPIISLSVDQ